jgi:hypothetical protein
MQRLPAMAAVLIAALAIGAVGAWAPAFASGSTPARCGSVNDGHRHIAINDLLASHVSCTMARKLASAYLRGQPLPSGWHVKPNSIVSFTRGSARVTGEEVG